MVGMVAEFSAIHTTTLEQTQKIVHFLLFLVIPGTPFGAETLAFCSIKSHKKPGFRVNAIKSHKKP
jgi:hypothetical protein